MAGQEVSAPYYPNCSSCGHNASGVLAFRCTAFVPYPEGDPREWTERWAALKDHLGAHREVRHDLAVESGGTSYDEGVIHGLEVALAKMAELEQS